jgi:bifunctional non-homologous end joining protein LigD
MSDLIQLAVSSRPRPRDYEAGIAFSVAEHKLDGHRVSIIKDASGSVRAVGRKLHIDQWDRVRRSPGLEALVATLPPMTVIDGELHVDGPATSVKAVEPEQLQYCAFACPVWDGDDCRELGIQDARTRMSQAGFAIPAVLERLESFGGFDQDVVDDWKRKCRDLRIEGLVLKQAHWSGWYKLKPTSTIDLVVYGVLPGCGKHAGRMGALMVGAHDERGRLLPAGKVGTGFTDVERERPRSEWLGRVIEVEYDSIAARGRLRFPSFLRIRDDKPASECRMGDAHRKE